MTSWYGPALGEDERDLARLLDTVAADRETPLTDDPALVAELVGELAALGVWTVAADEAHGGGGAGRAAAVVVWERLGRHWPALGWASVQAHAALAALAVAGADGAAGGIGAAGATGALDLAGGLHKGTEAVAVVDLAAPHARLDVAAGTARGRVARVDAAHPAPHLLLLRDGQCLLVRAQAVRYAPVARTGLDGALTRSAEIDGPCAELTGAPAGDVRAILRLGGAAVAAGIAGAAADAAVAYTRERRQFGGPLIDLPTVRRSVADQKSWVRTTLAAVCGADESPLAAAALLRHAADGAIEVAAAALQAHGGYGYLTEYPVERHLRDAVSLRAATAGHRADSVEET
ncbi:acyl-CoA dehydrogenase family protein [Acrocarpospora catenulata]|uniref:acyl-CoA dehydrogenase family protein n=1 Tax=Acrocarpospora catenulata TaxID=2836182 RepID=UPI001BD94E1D|nr:acyl-CoA dehydrogenase family protein [Acrocarpospora catenulata]